jgi:CheY-like chemotaxis protein
MRCTVKTPERRFEVVPLKDVLKRSVEIVRDDRVMNSDAMGVEREAPLTGQSAGPQSEHARFIPQSKTGIVGQATVKRVLVVDDERIIADSLAAILLNAGYEAVASYDAASALSLCATFRPQMIISDVVMPGLSGVKMAMLVKQRYPDCKILLFSGQAATASLLEEAQQSGYDFELLEKPVHPKTLLTKLSKEEQSYEQETSRSTQPAIDKQHVETAASSRAHP